MNFGLLSFVCAPEGILEFVSALGISFVIGLFAVVAFVGYFLTRDFYRFGRRGSSWLFAVTVSAFFSGGSYFLVGPVGGVVGAPFLVAFSIGRFRGRPGAEGTDEHGDSPSVRTNG